MRVLKFVQLDDDLVPISEIINVDISQIITETVLVLLKNGKIYTIVGHPALEIIWRLKPSALEGNRCIIWKKHMWAVHNIIAHPLMQIFAWFGAYDLAICIHDSTIPKPIGYKTY
jgi:hypothetical protein